MTNVTLAVYEVPSLQVLSLAANCTCSACDCEFVALARYLEVALVTVDKHNLPQFPNLLELRHDVLRAGQPAASGAQAGSRQAPTRGNCTTRLVAGRSLVHCSASPLASPKPFSCLFT